MNCEKLEMCAKYLEDIIKQNAVCEHKREEDKRIWLAKNHSTVQAMYALEKLGRFEFVLIFNDMYFGKFKKGGAE